MTFASSSGKNIDYFHRIVKWLEGKFLHPLRLSFVVSKTGDDTRHAEGLGGGNERINTEC